MCFFFGGGAGFGVESFLAFVWCICFFFIFTINQYCQLSLLYEPRSEKTGLQGLRPGPTQNDLYNHRRRPEA